MPFHQLRLNLCNDIQHIIIEYAYSVTEACKIGNMNIIQCLLTSFKNCLLSIYASAEFGHLDNLKICHKKYKLMLDADDPKYKKDAGLVVVAAENGHLHILKWCYVTQKEWFKSCAGNEMHTIECYLRKNKKYPWYLPICASTAVYTAALNGHFECVNWLCTCAKVSMNTFMEGNFDYRWSDLRHYQPIIYLWLSTFVKNSLANETHNNIFPSAQLCLDLLKWNADLKKACVTGDITALEYLITDNLEAEQLAKDCAIDGHLDAMKACIGVFHRITDNTRADFYFYWNSTLIQVAFKGHLHILKWLYYNNVVKFSSYAGHDGCVINLLSDFSVPVCDSAAIYAAAIKGHFKCVKWFCLKTPVPFKNFANKVGWDKLEKYQPEIASWLQINAK